MKLAIAHSSRAKRRINHLINASPVENTTDILLRYLSQENEKRCKETWELEDLILALLFNNIKQVK